VISRGRGRGTIWVEPGARGGQIWVVGRTCARERAGVVAFIFGRRALRADVTVVIDSQGNCQRSSDDSQDGDEADSGWHGGENRIRAFVVRQRDRDDTGFDGGMR